MRVRANCKINLGLRVVRKRDDGYHELRTVMFPVKGLYDIVDIEMTSCEGVDFAQSGIVVDCPADRNLTVRAARLMQQRFGVGGVRISLDKRVPFGAGLGGGSADATAVIVAINELCGLGLDKPALASLASELGSDTPYFVYNDAQYCTGRGEIMSSADVNLRGLWLAVVKPAEGVSTAEAYAGVRPRADEEDLCALLRLNVAEWQGVVVNDFEPHIFASHPRIAQLKALLMASGALYASMSGSGSALFGLFASRPDITLRDDEFLHIEQIG